MDEIRALAGTDRMTIPPPLLEQVGTRLSIPNLTHFLKSSFCSYLQLAALESPLHRELTPVAAAASCSDDGHLMGEFFFSKAGFRVYGIHKALLKSS